MTNSKSLKHAEYNYDSISSRKDQTNVFLVFDFLENLPPKRIETTGAKSANLTPEDWCLLRLLS